MLLKPMVSARLIYDNEDFTPEIYTIDDFEGIDVSESVKKRACGASRDFKERYDKRALFVPMYCETKLIDLNGKLPIHNYTGSCPAETFELNPVDGCNIGCMYCLVDDGIHKNITVYENYDGIVEKRLAEERFTEHYYYFSPKSEAFSEAALQTGIAHKILLAFIRHFERYPDSKARLFIASKAGVKALSYVFEGDSIIGLFTEIKDKMQFNISLSILPENLRRYIEPYAESVESRLKAAMLCRERGVMSDSALVQPILPNILSGGILDSFLQALKAHGIINIKPEFLTVSVENMVMLCQMLSCSKDLLKNIFEMYFSDENLNHIKQRSRTAPNREASKYWLSIIREKAREYGISTSICFWVRKELSITEDDIPLINENGFRCLGYQSRLF